MKYFNEELIHIIRFYDLLCAVVKNFGKENLTPAQEKRVLKAVREKAESENVQNKEIFFDTHLTYKKLLEDLKIREAQYNELAEKSVIQNTAVAKKLGEDFNLALSCFNQTNEYFSMKVIGEDAELMLLDNSAITKKLVLKDVSCEWAYIYFSAPLWLELSEYEDKYCLEIVYDSASGEQFHKIKIIFGSYEISTQVYNATNVVSFVSPWDYLDSVATALLLKARYAPDCLNEREVDLLPLAEALINIPELPDTKYDRALEYDKQEPLGDLAKTLFFYDDIAKLIEKKKLCIRTLCNKKHEGLWRVIYNKFLQSQEGYANSSEVICQKEVLEQRRDKITCILRGAGYKGEYPNFYKDDEIMLPKEVTTYSKNVIVAFEKNCRYHIKCIEQGEDILFICGYVCAGKNPIAYNDAFSASFYARGKRYFKSLLFYPSDEELVEIEFAPRLEVCATVAVKKAKAEKLTKEEGEYFFEDKYDTKEKISLFAFLMVIYAVTFGISMAIGPLIFELLFEPESFKQTLSYVIEYKFWLIGGTIGLVFGFIEGVAELCRSRK